jgi:hypothetical protein
MPGMYQMFRTPRSVVTAPAKTPPDDAADLSATWCEAGKRQQRGWWRGFAGTEVGGEHGRSSIGGRDASEGKYH